jgi:D-alanyl-D-alanine carboxypeptidase
MAAKAKSKPGKYAGIVVDARTGDVLYSENADNLRYPASLTKMMTLYLVFEALESGKIKLSSKVPVSKNAAAEPPSKLGLRPGSSITVEQAILGLVTRSANDASTAVGEFIGGSEARFAQLMTAKARALGMTRTTYRNANGLPNTAQMTTARDQARLGIALRKHFPQYYHYFSTRSFKFGRQVIGNHNRLLGVVRGVDGIKTGYTNAAGFNLVTSAQADGRSIVGVVLGAPSGGWRNSKMTQLVKTYLPQASRGRGQADSVASAVAEPAPTPEPAPVVAAAPVEEPVAPVAAANGVNLPESGPLPDARYAPDASLANATLSSSGQAGMAPKKKSAPGESSAALGYQNQADAAPAAEIAAAPAKAAEPEIDTVTTASTPKGWVVQVGVSPDKTLAKGLLDAAKAKGGKVLRSATPITVAVASGSSQLYRARFAGFEDQNAAVNACKALKRRGVSCWASAQ